MLFSSTNVRRISVYFLCIGHKNPSNSEKNNLGIILHLILYPLMPLGILYLHSEQNRCYIVVQQQLEIFATNQSYLYLTSWV